MIRRSLENDLEKTWPSNKWQDVPTVIAVSGGADSVALLRAIRANASNEKLLTVAHFNHRLRGEESDADQEFVANLSSEMGIAVETAAAPHGAIAGGKTQIGLEASARNVRYEFLRCTAEKIGARYLLTAHTADDQAETVLHNICRGTGLAGVAGIPFVRSISEAVTVIRPMLQATRAQVVAYLDELGQPYRSDSSNQSNEYTRNRIRNNVLPQLEAQVNPESRKHLCQLAQLAREAIDVLDGASADLESTIRFQVDDEFHVDRTTLSKMPDLLIVQFLKRCWNRQQWPTREMDSERWKRIVSIVKSKGDIWEHRPIMLPGMITVEATDSIVKFYMSARSPD